MNIVFVVGRHSDKNFTELFAPSAQRFPNTECFQIGDSPNEDGKIIPKSITEKYNAMTQILLQNNKINDDTIVVYSHEDINITDNLFDYKIRRTFENNPDVGIVGVAGVKQIEKGGWWFDEQNERFGHVLQGEVNKNVNESEHIVFGPVGYYDNIVAVEGFLFAVRGSLIRQGVVFDIEKFANDRNMYAVDLCMQCLIKGYKVAVADILVCHISKRTSSSNPELIESKKKFDEKYKDMTFPIKPSDIKVSSDEVLEVEL